MSKKRPTKDEWMALAKKAAEVAELLESLKHEAATLAIQCEPAIAEKLLDQIDKQLDGASPRFFASQVRPYLESVGGDSWTWREPQICSPQHYYQE